MTTVYVLYLVATQNSTSSVRDWLCGWYFQITKIVEFVCFEWLSDIQMWQLCFIYNAINLSSSTVLSFKSTGNRDVTAHEPVKTHRARKIWKFCDLRFSHWSCWRRKASWLWPCVICQVVPDILKNHGLLIFRNKYFKRNHDVTQQVAFLHLNSKSRTIDVYFISLGTHG